MRTSHNLLLACWLASTAPALAQSAALKPRVPPGPPTQGFAVALISEGIDYTQPGTALKLARDGEGEIIAWDTLDRDRRPFARDTTATQMVTKSPVLIVPLRIDPKREQSWIDAFDFLSRSPARVVVLALTADDPAVQSFAWPRMLAAKNTLFMLPAGAVLPQPADNILVLAALSDQASRTAAAAELVLAPATAAREAPGAAAAIAADAFDAAIIGAGLLTCRDLSAARSPADVKRLFLAKAQRGPAGQPPLLEACPPQR